MRLNSLLLAITCGTTVLSAADTYMVDPISTSAVFSVRHFNVANFYGTFDKAEGSLTWDAANAANSAITLTIHAESVDTNNTKRDDHLKSPDFFDVKQFPTMAFTSTGFKDLGNNKYEVAGNFTMHGVTKPMTITVEKTGEAKDPKGNMRLGFETMFTLKRSDFGMNYGLDNIGDEVRVIFSTEVIKQ